MLQFIKLGNIIKEIRQKRGIDEKDNGKTNKMFLSVDIERLKTEMQFIIFLRS